MKRIVMIMLALLLLLSAAHAEELPKVVQGLCGKAYPGYAVLAHDGYDDGMSGQWAIVLHNDGDNALVIAERTGGGDYAFTVDNPNAVPDEEYSAATHTVSVSLTKETARNDRLGFFEMTIEQPGVMKWVITSELQDDGRTWGNVISEYTIVNGIENTVWWSHVFGEGGTISYMRHTETPEGKPLSTDNYPDVPVEGGAATAQFLEDFDAGLYPYMPDRINGRQLADYASGFVPYGYTLAQLDLQEHALILLVESPQGSRSLRILPHENNQYKGTIDTKPLPQGAGLDIFHADEGELEIEWFDGENEYQFSFVQKALNQWEPSSLMVDGTVYQFTRNSIRCASEGNILPMRNDGAYYGDHPWQMIEEIDFAQVPSTMEAMLSTIDQSGYAVVNNPNPEDRLHLREQPRKDARSFGKFYNRTPVRVYAIEGEWAKVGIGSLTGYMMVKYLAFGEAMESVKCAFPQEVLVEGVERVALRPYREGKSPGMLDRETAFYIVGVEENRYVILTEDGTTGYLDRSYFSEGNG